MPALSFDYTIYIRSTPDRVWRGLLDPEYTRQYWMHDNVSDWRVGSRWQHVRTATPEDEVPEGDAPGRDVPEGDAPGRDVDGEEAVDIAGVVLEHDPERRLALSWARPEDLTDATKTSLLTIELEVMHGWPHGPWVELTITHEELDEEMLESVSFGWPATMSGLKTVLECGGFDADPSASAG